MDLSFCRYARGELKSFCVNYAHGERIRDHGNFEEVIINLQL
jgi:hypothetical protein